MSLRLVLLAISLSASLAAQTLAPVPPLAQESSSSTSAAPVTLAEATPIATQLEPISSSRTPVITSITVTQRNTTELCLQGDLPAASCSFNWLPALTQSMTFLSLQHAGNVSTYDKELKGPFFRNWFRSVANYRFSRWSDDDPFIVDYIGHPMMGAVAGRIQIQNDPRGMGLEFRNRPAYWKSRAKAMAFAAAYTVQWELGPASETSIGNLGLHEYYSPTAKRMTNGTGMVDLVVTPVAGTAWTVGEDLIDRYAIRKLEGRTRNPLALSAISVLNPTRSFANLLRWRAPWYRDSRLVKARW